MNLDRRKWLRNSGLVVGGLACGGFNALANEVLASEAERDVMAVVNRYARSVTTQEAATKTCCFSVKMRNHAAFARVFSGEGGHPFDRIHASGNTLSFNHKGVAFQIENVI